MPIVTQSAVARAVGPVAHVVDGGLVCARGGGEAARVDDGGAALLHDRMKVFSSHAGR